MKIVLISNYLPDQSQSMVRYAQMLERHLQARGEKVRVVYPPVIFGGLPFLRGGLKKWVGYIDKYLIAPWYLRRACRGAEVVHVCDHSNSMYLRCAGKTPSVLTCHDLLAVNAARGRYAGIRIGATGRVQQRWIAAGVRSARWVICVSEKTKQDVLELGPASGAELCVIHNPLNLDYRPADADEVRRVLAGVGLAEDAEYLFHVGGNQWYKNRLGVLHIFAELKKLPRFAPTKLVMAGQPWTAEMRAFADAALQRGDTVEATEVSNRDLQAFYSGALALLFPSREEGFGWPILEAQACGCPVITTNRGPMTEIAGGAAVLIEPEKPREAAEAIARAVPEFSRLREMGFRNVARFAAEGLVGKYLEVYRAACEQRASAPRSAR